MTTTPSGRPQSAAFRRIWRMPERCLRGSSLTALSPRGRYLLERSKARFAARPDACLPSMLPLKGELGCIESFRIIISKELA